MGEILMRQMFYAVLENFNLGEFSPLVGIHFHPSGKDAGRKQRVDLDSEGAGFFSCPSFAKGRRNIPLFGTGCVFSSVQPGGGGGWSKVANMCTIQKRACVPRTHR